MEFSKHKNYRNPQYLKWIRSQDCLVSGAKAQCAHHVGLRTNGGKGIKPSDYFCIPLTHDYHTLGLHALHMIGEESFFKQFKVNIMRTFIQNLTGFLRDQFDYQYKSSSTDPYFIIYDLISEIEMRRPITEKKKIMKVKKKINHDSVKTIKMSEDPYYQKAREFRRQKDKALRVALKESAALNPDIPKKKVPSVSKANKKANSDYYEKGKEIKRKLDKENRDKHKLKAQEMRREIYKRAKER
jgi:hypothetical protein